ncbi:(+)-larreatricin hydroxylase, chloroplastic [Dichanthelium oligosanthes]|uniref:(+)-larreatricin hydroxylase, chloroplastic n=1 Tax=Dichanthelium oligosanthes TaxID=888268 RepID=A0A1E5UM04_9POAL|nr:(+)-larreatricin hydroxylase, chloroplastic [Dichanthelium oligosanthes]
MASANATSSLLAPAISAASTPSACPSTLSKKATAIRRRRTVSCRATGGRSDRDDGLLWLPRREMLTGLSGVAAGLVGYPDLAAIALEANPVESCRRGEKVNEKLVECSDPNRNFPCPPSSQIPIVDFKKESTVKRIRKAAHLLDKEYQEKYKEAVGKMRALPESNPLSFAAQAAVHESYCDGHYRYDPTEKNRPFDVHFSWIFAPWHRMYIYFYEKALGQLIGDDTFALPFWNWDAPGGMAIPAVFKDSFANPLYDPYRDMKHRDALIDLDFIHTPATTAPIPFERTPDTAAAYDALVQKNLNTIYYQQIRGAGGPRAYLGEKLCSEASFRVKEINERSKRRQDGPKIKVSSAQSQGTLERMAHTAVHVWAGRENPKGGCTLSSGAVLGHDGKPHCANDMGFLGSAGRDPLFYSHHANVDRMWHIWSTKLGGKGFDDPEWLDASFVFYDDVEKPRLVRMKFRDVLDSSDLGYTYDESEAALPWINSTPTRLSPAGKGAAAGSKAAPEFPLTLTSGQTVVVSGVAVPAKQPGKDLVLLIEGIEYDPKFDNKFDVAINVPKEDASKLGPQHIEYAGSFSAVPSSKADGGTLLGKITLFVDGVLDDLGAAGDATVDIVLVPRTAEKIQIYLPPTIENA